MTRASWLLTTILAASGGASIVDSDPPKALLWNVSASAPVGLYVVQPATDLQVPDLVAVPMPQQLRAFLEARGDSVGTMPLLKRVLALPGQRVCRIGFSITVDGIEMGKVLEHDRFGNRLPAWKSCVTLGADDVFLMNWQVPDSLDGRYFGLAKRDKILGRAVPVLTDEAGDGRYVWRTETGDER